MRSLRHLGLVLWLALAVLAGQQVVLRHDLGHATQAALHDEGPAPGKCEQHSACAQLTGALTPSPFAAAFVASAPPRAAAFRAREASLAPRRAFLSRAPPVFLA